MDMSTFYDTIQLNKLQDEAVRLDYPPLLLELAMQLYTGPKAILAEQEMTPFFHVEHGVPAGCPQAPLLAKVVLPPALIPWKQQHPDIHLSSWVDDVGFDLKGSTLLQVAQQAVEAYRDLCKHQLVETTKYLKCTQCGVNIHKRVNEAALTAFIQSLCVNQEYHAQHTGHPTHVLWQVGERGGNQCGTQWNLDGNQRLIATQALHKPCKGASTKGSPPLSEFFKKKDNSGSQSQASTSNAQDEISARPTPKRLHFNTELDEHEALNQQLSALAMNPSHTAETDSDAEDNAAIEVDFF